MTLTELDERMTVEELYQRMALDEMKAEELDAAKG